MAKNNNTGLKEKNSDIKAHEPRIKRLESGLFASKDDIIDVKANMATRDDIKQTENRLDKRIDKVENDTKEIRKTMATKDDLKQTENRLNDRMDRLNVRMDRVENRIDKLETNMGKRLDKLEKDSLYIKIGLAILIVLTTAENRELIISLISTWRG